MYNEQIHDLLEPKGPLAIREDPDKGVVVQGLSFHQVRDWAQGGRGQQPLWSSGDPSPGCLGMPGGGGGSTQVTLVLKSSPSVGGKCQLGRPQPLACASPL